MTPKNKVAFISESLCIGCGICVKKCPFEAINIINLPKDLESNTTHRYGANTFKLHRYERLSVVGLSRGPSRRRAHYSTGLTLSRV